MKKIKLIFVMILMSLFSMSVFTACDGFDFGGGLPKLSTPKITYNNEEKMLYWDEIKDAVSYTLKVEVVEAEEGHGITDEEYPDYTDTYISIDGIPAGTYIFFVKAVGNKETHRDSDFGQIEVVSDGVAGVITKLMTPKLTFDEKAYTIKWNPVPKAISYVLRLTVLEMDKEIDFPSLVEENDYQETTLPLSGSPKGKFKLEVRANSGDSSIQNSDYASIEFTSDGRDYDPGGGIVDPGEKLTKLNAPKNVKITLDTISWDRVDNAVSYTVKFQTGQTIEGIKTTSCEMPKLDLEKYIVGVKAVGDGVKFDDSYYMIKNFYFDSEGKLVVLEDEYEGDIHVDTPDTREPLKSPSNIRAEGSYLVWDKVPNATSYRIDLPGFMHDSVNENRINVSGIAILEMHVITITAIDDTGTYRDSERLSLRFYVENSGKIVFENEIEKPKPPTNLRVLGEILYWDAVNSAVHYEVIIFKDGMNVYGGAPSETYLDISHLESGATYIIRVRAMVHTIGGGAVETEFSEDFLHTKEQQLAKREKVMGLYYDETGRFIAWQSDANSFLIRIDGKEVFEINNTWIFHVQAKAPGLITYEVLAKGDGIMFLDSDWSEPLEVMVGVNLGMPVFFGYEEGSIFVQWTAIDRALGYSLMIDDTVIENLKDPSYHCVDLSEGIHIVKVKAIGDGIFDMDSEWSDPLTIIIKEALLAPTNFLFNKDTKTLYWDAVYDASSYRVRINYDDNQIYYIENAKWICLDFLPSGYYPIEVMAVSNNELKSDSLWANTTGYFVPYQLNVPDGIVDDGYNIYWNAVNNYGYEGVKYKIRINGTDIVECEYKSYFYSDLGAGAYTLEVMAYGGEQHYDSAWSEPLTVYCYKQLDTPDQIRIDGDILRWDAVENADYYVVGVGIGNNVIQYYIYDVITNYYEGDFLVPEYYMFSVQAFSNSEYYLDSLEWYYDINIESVIINELEIKKGTSNEYVISPAEGHSLSGDIVIPGEYRGVPISAIRGFSGIEAITSITIEEGVRWIYDSAFENCTGLVEVNFPQSLEVIGAKVFKNCSSIKEIDIPNKYAWVSDDAFVNCTALKSFVLAYDENNDSNTLFIGNGVFVGCDSLEYMDIPLQFGTFARMFTPSEIAMNGQFDVSRVPQSLKTVKGCFFDVLSGDYFMDCQYIETIIIVGNINSMQNNAFKNCIALKDIQLPEGTKVIGSGAFENCISLESIVLPEGIESISYAPFKDCINLTSVVFPSSVKSFSVCFENNPKLTSLTLSFVGYSLSPDTQPQHRTLMALFNNEKPSNLKEVIVLGGDILIHAFSGWEYLEKIVICKDVTYIDQNAFYLCDSLTIYAEGDESERTNWHDDWNALNYTVVWNYEVSKN